MQPEQEKYKYEYNGKEFQGEFSLNWSDYGARNYDASLGRWVNLDNKSELYFANSPYNYAINNVVNAVGTDGKLVIFINGLGGGGKSYWREYKKEYTNEYTLYGNYGLRQYRYKEVRAFDKEVMNKLQDHKAMYFDGSPGSIFNNLTSGQRYESGWNEGYKSAEKIINSLARDKQGNITETIKIITHSMGGVYGKGFVAALTYYIKTSKDPQVRRVQIALVADFDPYQAGSSLGNNNSNIFTQQFIHSNNWNFFGFGWLANEEEKDLDDDHKKTNTGDSTDHSILSFFGDIKNLQEGKYEWNDDKQEWICINCGK